ncbi:MAG: DNA repair protein RecN [Alphaproteobacteria bacterium]|nr:DNA repair protein RecN [Alphaproteobacteria bacterium]
MLKRLGIRDVVLIHSLDVDFAGGLGVLTGETGAGKSILLDALGLALGGRADAGLVRRGANQAMVSATFEVSPTHPAIALLVEHELAEADLAGDGLILIRRTVTADGRSRAHINDQPVSIGLLRTLGRLLVEVHGQFDQHGLMDEATHAAVLDAFAGISPPVAEWQAWSAARRAASEAVAGLEKARAEEDLMRAQAADLADLAPQPGEEAELAARRTRLQQAGRTIEALTAAMDAVSGDDGAERRLAQATRVLSRLPSEMAALVEPVLASLDRAGHALAEASQTLERLQSDDDLAPGGLEAVEERLFAIRAAARRHGCHPDALAEVHASLTARLAALEDGAAGVARASDAAAAARTAYLLAAEAVSRRRSETARRLDAAVQAELPDLRLEKARFETRLESLSEADWGPGGTERVAFRIATNPGAAPGPLGRIASGGELARIMLALKVVLAGVGAVPTLVFDEVDAGIGGATADAVGARLARLGRQFQILVVTHAPQVAARAAWHVRVVKSGDGDRVETTIDRLDTEARREEIARMLAGAVITDAARAAADQLMAAS